MKSKLILTFDHPFSTRLSMVMPLEEHIAHDTRFLKPPLPAELGGTFEETIEVLRKREYRRDLFTRSCTALGAQLAERMEDAEGWHDISRIAPAWKELTT